MTRGALRQIDYQRMIRALRAEGVAVEKLVLVVGVRGLAFLRADDALSSIAAEDEANEWDEVLRPQ